jgi:hypothetical protein
MTVAYKGSGKKGRIQSGEQPRGRRTQIGGPSPDVSNFGAPKPSNKQSGSGGNTRKTHDTKGRNNHGRSGGYGRS